MSALDSRFGALYGEGARDSLQFLTAGASAAEGDYSYYCKLLVSNQLAGIIIGSAGQEIRSLKSSTGAKVALSPHGMHFPGTTERLAAIEGCEQSVFQVLDWILDKVHEQHLSATTASHQEQHKQQQQQHVVVEEEAADSWRSRVPCCIRICVPRAVVGSLIGKNGGYIQSLRVATGASINISPLFVNADQACAERIVSVESTRKRSLKAALYTLIRKVNAHPDKASCKHVCYYRKLAFDAPPQSDNLLLLQQQQQEQEQQDEMQQKEDAYRTRTVSQVLGCTRGLRLSSPPGFPVLDQFASFKRFCETRNSSSSNSSNAGSTRMKVGAPDACNLALKESSLGVKLQQVADRAKAAGNNKAAAAAASRESLSTVCSSLTGSNDRLPSVRTPGSTAAAFAAAAAEEFTTEQRANAAANARIREARQLQQQQNVAAAAAAATAEDLGRLQGQQQLLLCFIGALIAVLLAIILRLWTQRV